MELDPDEIDVQLRSPVEVGHRMIALSAVSHLLGGVADDAEDNTEDEDDDEDVASSDATVGERFDWLTWLTQERLLDALSPAERELLTRAFDLDSASELDEEGSAGEALGALAWAVQRSDRTVLDRGYPYLDLLNLVPSPWDDATPFLATLALRPEPEIAMARESAEILSWRAEVEIERRQANRSDRADIETAIRDVAAEAGAAAVAVIGIDGDLMIAGESIRALSDTVISSMAAAARARLRAMNWLCGLGDWDDPALTEI